MKEREKGGGWGVLPAMPTGGASSRAGMSLRLVIGWQERGLGLTVELGPEGQQLGPSVSDAPAAPDLSGAFPWPPHQDKRNTAWLDLVLRSRSLAADLNTMTT